MQEKGTGHVAKPRIRRGRRRELVQHLVRLHGTVSPSRIREYVRQETGQGIARETIKDDIDLLMADNDEWKNDQARAGWSEKVRQFFTETNEEISKVRETMDELLRPDPQVPDRMVSMLQGLDGDAQAEAISYLQAMKARTQLAARAEKIGRLASVLTEKRAFLIKMMTDRPLYDRTEELARMVEEVRR